MLSRWHEQWLTAWTAGPVRTAAGERRAVAGGTGIAGVVALAADPRPGTGRAAPVLPGRDPGARPVRHRDTGHRQHHAGALRGLRLHLAAALRGLRRSDPRA